MKPLTQRQREVVAAIVKLTARHGYPPTLRELGDELGIASSNGMRDHLRLIELKGAIVRTPAISRGIRVVTQ